MGDDSTKRGEEAARFVKGFLAEFVPSIKIPPVRFKTVMWSIIFLVGIYLFLTL